MRHPTRLAATAVAALLLLSGCGFGGGSGDPAAAGAPKGTPYGTVDGHTITAKDVVTNAKLSALGQASAPKLTPAALESAWNNLVDQELVLLAHPVTPDPAEVSQIMSQETQYLESQHGGSTASLNAYLKKQGLTTKDVSDYVSQYVAIQTALGEAISSQVGTAQEKAYVKQHPEQFQSADVRHILVKSKSLAETILKDLTQNDTTANWDALAKKYSTDTGSKDKGGVYDNVTWGEMVTPFNNATFSWKIGKIGIVHSIYGYHVLQVMSRKPLSATEADQAAYQSLYNAAVGSYLAKLRKAARITEHVVGKK
jgi:foldase protein PrsA